MPLAVSFDAALQESQPDVAEALHGGVVYRRFVLNCFPCSIIVTVYTVNAVQKNAKNRLYNDAGIGSIYIF